MTQFTKFLFVVFVWSYFGGIKTVVNHQSLMIFIQQIDILKIIYYCIILVTYRFIKKHDTLSKVLLSSVFL